MSGPEWVGVAALGAAGALARVAISTAVARWRHSVFPLGTLVVNLTGGFALGILVGVLGFNFLGDALRDLLDPRSGTRI